MSGGCHFVPGPKSENGTGGGPPGGVDCGEDCHSSFSPGLYQIFV